MDWEQAIRRGVGGDGRVLAIMPSHIYQHYSDQDLGAVVAYLKSIPPVDHDLGRRRMGFSASVLLNGPPMDELTHINSIDHGKVGGEAPPVGATAEYGQYLGQDISRQGSRGDKIMQFVAISEIANIIVRFRCVMRSKSAADAFRWHGL